MTYHLAHKISAHENEVRGLCSYDSIPGSFVSCSFDKTIKLWIPSNGKDGFKCDKIFAGHSDFVIKVQTLGKDIVSIGHDRKCNIYDVSSGEVKLSKVVHDKNGSCIFVSPTHICTGGWDYVGKVWNHSLESLATLKGHLANILCIAELENGRIVTGCGDASIKIWNPVNQQVIRTIKGHRTCVRAFLIAPGVGFFSTSNDGTVVLWDNNGDKLDSFQAHSSLVYNMCRMDETRFCTASEDQSVKIWEGKGKLLETLEHPACVWDVCVLPNKDIAVACANGSVYIWSTDETQKVEEEVLETFKDEIFKSKQKRSGVDVNKLATEDELKIHGKKNGEIKMINVKGRGKVFQWSSSQKQWILLGDLVDGPGSEKFENKKLLDGQFYDFVFDVEIGEGSGQTEKIGYNLGEDPWKVAQNFIYKHNLSQNFLDTVANFIVQHSGQGFYGVKSRENFDPYFMGNNNNNNTQPKKQIEMKKKHFPITSFEAFDKFNWEGVMGKINSFNDTLKDEDPLKLDAREFKLLKRLETKMNRKGLDALCQKVLKWESTKLFPGIDLLRFIILQKKGRKYFKGEESPSIFQIMNQLLMICLGEKTTSFPLQLTFLKLITNLISIDEYKELGKLSVPFAIKKALPHVISSEKDSLRVHGIKLLINACLLLDKQENVDIVLENVLEMIKSEQRRNTKLSNTLLYLECRILGTLLSSEMFKDDVMLQCEKLEVLKMIQSLPKANEKIKAVIIQCEEILKQ